MAKNAKIGGVALARSMPETAPTLGFRATKNPTDKGWVLGKWWRRGGSNPRPQALYNAIYMLSPVIWVLVLARRPNRLVSDDLLDFRVRSRSGTGPYLL